nr:NAD-glutamate dehydrogenase [Epidermidibacterium keratini]
MTDQLRNFDLDESADIERIADSMPAGYRANFSATAAIEDIGYLRRLERADADAADPVEDPATASGIAMRLFLPGQDGGNILESAEDQRLIDTLRLRVYSIGTPMLLSRVLPILQDLGVEVSDENTFDFDIRDEHGNPRPAWIYDFTMTAGQMCGDTSDLEAKFTDAVAAAWSGVAESDKISSLVLRSGFTWRQVALLRAYVRYMQMGSMTYSRDYIESVLVENPAIVEKVIELFNVYFDPERDGDRDARDRAAERIQEQIRELLVDVKSLDADRILTALGQVVIATVRTNFFQRDEEGHPREVISFKLDPHQLPQIPSPKPYREFWVYSPRFEATHLRFGGVARGGLRWSDRREDLRTEILGLVKAQIVKNTVIVPTGAKGGFVAKQLPDQETDRDGWMAEGVACYRSFIRSMLQLTDNRVGDEIVPPAGVIRRDEDDPYLVVAADKGTATFSDYANEEATAAGFWLGDAFASGGSAGYDHKAMGITARGAWESVKRHFRELGVDTQTEDFTAIGIGDMSGDVFGNGMLLSEHTRLIAAFDHRDIFIDPNPDAATSYAERRRLFELPRSSWADYDSALISKGGGVWSRQAKSIPITAAMRDALGIDGSVSSPTPNELIRAILLAPVDLFWNGGIGTYVKSSSETNAETGDRANDPIRVDGRELRVKVVGEGGNLGFTQRGRIEYALHGHDGDGGKINSDAIDNSAGVDTSDHEVNIKILLGQAIDDGALKADARDKLLLSMTDEVGDLVLEDNYDQNVALQMEERNNLSLNDAHRRLMNYLEKRGLLDRSIEFLPSDDELSERFKAGRGLTSPELSVLLAYSKILMQGWILGTDLPDDPAYQHLLSGYFPTPLRDKYAKQMPAHPLHREIVATQISNRIVNNAGTTGPMRMMEETGASSEAVLRAQTSANRIFELPQLYDEVAELDNKVPADIQTSMRIEQQRLVERATRWFLRNCEQPIDIVEVVKRYAGGVAEVFKALPKALTGIDKDSYEGRLRDLEYAEVPAKLAQRVAVMPKAIAALDIVDLAEVTGATIPMISSVYFQVAEKLELAGLLERIIAMPRDDRWRAMARGTLRDDLNGAHAELTGQVLASKGRTALERIESWYAELPETSVQALDMLAEIMAGSSQDLASIVVAVQLVRDVVGGTTTTH